MSLETKPRFYLPELDGLRFIAFLLVFIHNANPILKRTFLERFSEYSWFGVDLFFCLSGFLITKLLVMEHRQTGKINFRNFYIRRILKIWPLYFFYLILGSIIIAPVDGRNINLPWHIVSLSTFTFNFAYLALLPSPILIFVHLWSISYEEQFYAAIPWLTRKLASAAQNTRTNWFIFLFGMGCVIRALFIQFRVHPAAIYFLPITHFESLLGGIALGLGILEPILTRFKTRTLWVTVLALTSSIFILPNNNVTEWGLMLTYLCVGAFTTLLLYVLITQPYSPITRFVGNSLFTQLGKISYGLYIFHFGCFMLAASIVDLSLKVQQPVLPLHTLLILCIAFALTIIFASISYRFIEKPALSLKRKFSALPTGLK